MSGLFGRGHGVLVVAALVLAAAANSAVVWNLDLAGGTQRTAADLRAGRDGAHSPGLGQCRVPVRHRRDRRSLPADRQPLVGIGRRGRLLPRT
jgi:hypothetical protein